LVPGVAPPLFPCVVSVRASGRVSGPCGAESSRWFHSPLLGVWGYCPEHAGLVPGMGPSSYSVVPFGEALVLSVMEG
jgi:hypothetical protein